MCWNMYVINEENHYSLLSLAMILHLTFLTLILPSTVLLHIITTEKHYNSLCLAIILPSRVSCSFATCEMCFSSFLQKSVLLAYQSNTCQIKKLKIGNQKQNIVLQERQRITCPWCPCPQSCRHHQDQICHRVAHPPVSAPPAKNFIWVGQVNSKSHSNDKLLPVESASSPSESRSEPVIQSSGFHMNKLSWLQSTNYWKWCVGFIPIPVLGWPILLVQILTQVQVSTILQPADNIMYFVQLN